MTYPIQHPITTRKLGAIAATFLLLAGAAMPAAAQVKLARDLSAERSAKGSFERAVAGDYAAGALTAAELRQIVEVAVEAQTHQWNASEKSVMKAVMALAVDEAYLVELAALSKEDLSRQLKHDQKLSDLKGLNLSHQAALKVLPAAFVIRAAAWAGARLFDEAANGVVNEIIQMSAPNLTSLFSALRAGDTVQFQSLLASSFPRQETFVRLTGAAASSFCETATLGLRKRTCIAFSQAAQGAAEQIRLRSHPTVRPTSPTRRPARSLRSPLRLPGRSPASSSRRLSERLSNRLFGLRKGSTATEQAQLK